MVLAAIGFALGMVWSAIGLLADGRYLPGLICVAFALLPFGAWAVVRWVVVRRAANS